jgi:hypothetical protein
MELMSPAASKSHRAEGYHNTAFQVSRFLLFETKYMETMRILYLLASFLTKVVGLLGYKFQWHAFSPLFFSFELL